MEGLSFEAWQRKSTLLFPPANSVPGKAREVVPVDPDELAEALAADARDAADGETPVRLEGLARPACRLSAPPLLVMMIVVYAILRTG